MGVIWRLARRGFRLGLAVLAVTLAAVIYSAETTLRATLDGAEIATPVDAVIVLGGGVEGDGRLAYNSRRRVAGGVALLEAGRARHLIFTGGLGRSHPTMPAAALMRDHAEALGADPARLILEPRAVSTFENLRFSFEIAEDRGFDRLAILSDAYHLTRAGWLAAYFGRADLPRVAVAGAETRWWPHRAVTLTREALAWWLNLAKVAGWEALGRLGMSEDARAGYIR